MTDLSKLTAKDFSDAMHKGYGKLKWCAFDFFQDASRKTVWTEDWKENPSRVAYACAFGAMAYHLKTDPMDVYESIEPHDIARRALDASNFAGNKRAAMKAVDAILLAKVSS